MKLLALLWSLRSPVRRFLQYVYYLRFALLLLLVVPVIAYLDHSSQLIHSIFTPERPGQFFGSAFFAVCIGCVALILSRIVCFNGEERFGAPANHDMPSLLRRWLGELSEGHVLRVLAIYQLPSLALLWRLHTNAVIEEVPLARGAFDVVYMLGGVLVAFAFWYLVSAVYYWTFPFQSFKRSARTMLFPRKLFFLPPYDNSGAAGAAADNIEQVDADKTSSLARWTEEFFSVVARLLGPGYQDDSNPLLLLEGHRFAIIAVVGYLTIYTAFFPFSAPLPQPLGNRLAFLGLAVGHSVLALYFIQTSSNGPVTATFRASAIAAYSALALFCLYHGVLPHLAEVHPLGFNPPFQFFPVLASVEILVTLILLVLAGLAFLLDRFTLPVFTSLFLILFLLHLTFARNGEHYFAAIPPKPSLALDTPDELMHQRCTGPGPCSLIVVTATGGGIHAAVWTSTVLGHLEEAMLQPPVSAPGPKTGIASFHQGLFLASTVSGGSLGLASFLREYTTPVPFDPAPLHAQAHNPPAGGLSTYQSRMFRATSCSSLEAVAWGLSYSDFLHVFFPWLKAHPNHDRSASLELASARNYTSAKCGVYQGADPPGLDVPEKLSLGGFPPSTATPAFSMNTTAVETGDRFLLANYRNKEQMQQGVVPAESFLHVYPADIGIMTAARLSATYPYISSAARISPEISPGAEHFVDGGYYDNDGVATAIEFLASASDALKAQEPEQRAQILFLEIRDGYDLDGSVSKDSFCKQQAFCKLWGTGNQLDAPPEAFFKTGHGSVTGRNRRELFILEQALQHKAKICHVVFPFPAYTPLSWQLTQRQIDDFEKMLKSPSFIDSLRRVRTWQQTGACPS